MSLKKTFFLAASAGAILLQSGNAFADKCLTRWESDQWREALGDKSSWGIPRQQASRPFEDWVWRGPEFFRCPSWGVNHCTDSYGKSHTQGYSWTVGLELNFGGIPVIGGFTGLVTPSGNYSRNESWTESWSRSVNLQPGFASRPIQVVMRRWKSGNFRGMHVRSNQRCLGPARSDAYIYKWDGNRTYGYWQGNLQEGRWFGYQTYKY